MDNYKSILTWEAERAHKRRIIIDRVSEPIMRCKTYWLQIMIEKFI